MKVVVGLANIFTMLFFLGCNQSRTELHNILKAADTIKISRYYKEDTAIYYVTDANGLAIFKKIISGDLKDIPTGEQVGLIQYCSNGKPILEVRLVGETGIAYDLGDKAYKGLISYQAGMYIDQVFRTFSESKNKGPVFFIDNDIRDQNKAFVTTSGDFPDKWIKTTDIDSLIKLVKSKEKCACLVNPLSSYIPIDSNAELGGYAIDMISSYREGRNFSFSLWTCPKESDQLADSLILWYSQRKKTRSR